MIKRLPRACLAVTAAVIVGAGLSVAGFVAPTAASAATCQITVAHPNISIHEDAQFVSYPYTNKCGHQMDSAVWAVVGPSGWLADYVITPNASVVYYDWSEGEHLGSYKLVPQGAYDTNFNSVPQATEYFKVKLGVRLSISGYRTSNYVHLHAYETRYNPDVSAFVPAYKGLVTFWGKIPGGSWWKGPSVYTNGNGWTAYVKLYVPRSRYFRATVAETAYRWGASSGTIYR
jgi:hypothetical protein